MIFDKFQVKGKWWLPENPRDKVWGVLDVSPKGNMLDLSGFFKIDPNKFDDYEILNGLTDELKEITLLNSSMNDFSIIGFSSVKCKISSQFVLIGKNYNSIKEIEFLKLRISFTYMDDWLSSNLIERKIIPDKEDNKRINEYHLKFKVPKSINYKIATINSELSFNEFWRKRDGRRNVEYKYASYIEITPFEKKDLYWFRKKINHLSNLFTILFNHAVYIKDYTFIGDKIKLNNNEFNEYIIFFERDYIEPKLQERIYEDSVIFKFTELKGIFDSILNKWFDLTETLILVNRFMEETYHEKVIRPHSYFLTYYHCLEGLLRNMNSGKINIGRYLDLLLNKNAFLNLYKIYIPDKPKFIKEIIQTRNHLIHYNKVKNKEVVESYNLFDLSLKMKLILLVNYFDIIGVPTELINKAFRKDTIKVHFK